MLFCVVSIVVNILWWHNCTDGKVDEYMQRRAALLHEQFEKSFENDVTLTANEQLANQIIIEAKREELNRGLSSPFAFNPSRHIFDVLQNITESKLFKILRKMPKGGILHSHSSMLASANYLVNLTYWPNLWQCTTHKSIHQFLFSRMPPTTMPAPDCIWTLVATERQNMGAAKYDEYVRTFFTLYDKNANPVTQYRDINDVWIAMEAIVARVSPILGYAPVRKLYYKQGLTEILADNVQYLEFRSTLSKVKFASLHFAIY